MNPENLIQRAKTTGLILLAITLFVTMIVLPDEPELSTAQDACRLPAPNEKLIVTLNHADGKPTCTYHRVVGWGMAR